MNDWYQTLRKPPLTPPSWLFGPAWTVLYLMIALSLFFFFRADRASVRAIIYILLGLHIIANIVWTPLFFGLRSMPLALVDILILDATLIYLIVQFWQVSKVSSLLLVPYLLWVTFATYLNAGFLVLNIN